MKLDYVFYKTDESFDYGDFPNSTCYQEAEHGFSIEQDPKTDKFDIETLEAYGDYCEMNNIKTLQELKEYLISHLNEVEEFDVKLTYTNKEVFEELIEMLA